MGDPVTALERIMPKGAVCVEIACEGEEESYESGLSADELETIAGSSDGRRREFAAGRACARRALRQIGVAATSIPMGTDGAPIWPSGVVGSITHKRNYRAAVVAPSTALPGIGLDAELNESIPTAVLDGIALPEERSTVKCLLGVIDDTAWDRLLFSAKEAAVKAAHPLAAGRLDLRSTAIAIDAETCSFRALPGFRNPRRDRWNMPELTGRWVAREGMLIVVAAAAVLTPKSINQAFPDSSEKHR